MEKFKFTLLFGTVGNGDGNFNEITFEVEGYSCHVLPDAFRKALALLGADVLSGIADYTMWAALRLDDFGGSFGLCNGVRPGTFEWCCSAEISALTPPWED